MLTQQKRTTNLRKESFDLFFKNFIVLENQYKLFPNGKIYTKNLYELCRDPNLDFSLVREFSDYIWDWNMLSKHHKLDINTVLQLDNKEWDWYHLTYKIIEFDRYDIIENYPDRDWNHNIIK